MEIIRDIEQGSDEWMQLRTGSVGASSLSRIITSKGKRSSQRKDYLYKIAAERLTGERGESFSNKNMENGHRMEPQTRMAFQLETMKQVEQVAMIFPDGRPGWHVSPDGIIVGEDAGLELKSPIASTQVKRLDKNVLPTEYKLQCQMSLFVTGWPVWYFCSRSRGLPLLILEVERDEALIGIIKEELERFIFDLDQIVKKVA